MELTGDPHLAFLRRRCGARFTIYITRCSRIVARLGSLQSSCIRRVHALILIRKRMTIRCCPIQYTSDFIVIVKVDIVLLDVNDGLPE